MDRAKGAVDKIKSRKLSVLGDSVLPTTIHPGQCFEGGKAVIWAGTSPRLRPYLSWKWIGMMDNATSPLRSPGRSGS